MEKKVTKNRWQSRRGNGKEREKHNNRRTKTNELETKEDDRSVFIPTDT